MTGLELLLLKLLFGGGAAATVFVCLKWKQVRLWIERHRAAHNGTAEVVKRMLADGNYQVIGNVFDPGGVKVSTKTWTARSLDAELQAQFGNSDRVSIGVVS